MTAVILFACVHNAGRSQMAAAWLSRLANLERAQGLSAGTEPATAVHPVVQVAMAEVGIDLSSAVPRRLTAELLETVTHLFTMGCGEACPVAPPGVARADWPLADPKGGSLEAVRAIRDEIRERVAALIAENGWG